MTDQKNGCGYLAAITDVQPARRYVCDECLKTGEHLPDLRSYALLQLIAQ